MIVFDDFTAVDSNLRQLAADWLRKGDVALMAFSNGHACECARLIAETRSAVEAATSQNHSDRADLVQIETLARKHMQTVRAKQRIEGAVHVALDAGVRGADLIDWVAEIYEQAYAARAAKKLVILP